MVMDWKWMPTHLGAQGTEATRSEWAWGGVWPCWRLRQLPLESEGLACLVLSFPALTLILDPKEKLRSHPGTNVHPDSEVRYLGTAFCGGHWYCALSHGRRTLESLLAIQSAHRGHSEPEWEPGSHSQTLLHSFTPVVSVSQSAGLENMRLKLSEVNSALSFSLCAFGSSVRPGAFRVCPSRT